ncbi:MAG: DnaJ domain-containing protein [Bryobacterales bacterium]|nr:DnaJ domain-containing protein [Bryobacterales bacterium]
MTYYEELGVPMTASTEEIREAYKHLARLLHPDKLSNPDQRKVAECQMRRLNAVYEALSSPAKRRNYDLTLHPSGFPPDDALAEAPLTGWPWLLAKIQGPDGVWIAAAAIVAVMIGYALFSAPSQTHRPASVPAASAARPVEKPAPPRAADTRRKPDHWDAQMAQLRHRVEDLTTERDAALQRVATLEARWRDTAKRTESAAHTATASGRAPPASGPDPEPRHTTTAPPAAESPSLAGTWYFAKTRSNAPTDLYPPEFIETVIQEENGAFSGRYRARYVVSDRAISPEVAFQFRARPGADSSRIPWTGAGGAKGEVKLKLLTANSLEVAWVAHDLGKSLGLAYGTAVLIRAANPQ